MLAAAGLTGAVRGLPGHLVSRRVANAPRVLLRLPAPLPCAVGNPE